MLKKTLTAGLLSLLAGILVACSSTPYTPVASRAPALDTTAFTPKVENFVVLLDTSGSMDEEFQGRQKIETAEDLVASFGSAVPPMKFKAALGIFGRGIGTCLGYGAAETIYGLSSYDSAKFASALGSIECAAGTTPIADAVSNTGDLLADAKGATALVIVSDFKWSDPDAVEEAVAALKSAHPGKLCLHTIKVGDEPGSDAVISRIANNTGCDSAVNADSLASGEAMSRYVADTLLTPVVIHYEKHTLSAVTLFDFDKAVLKEEGKAALQELAAGIKASGMKVEDINVTGYTDSIGSESYNQGLSVRRAMAVKDYLVSEGVNADIIDASGAGESNPVASNDTAAGRAENRRVEVEVGTSSPAH
jgi:OOP family OmpA-OmpF porin